MNHFTCNIINEPPPEIVIPHRITRTFIQKHPEWNFLYSFDVAGKSALGQSWFAHNEPNTFGVVTLYKFCSNPVYFQDNDEVHSLVADSINHIPLDKPIIPFPKIGEGHSRMKEFAPEAYAYLHKLIEEIRYSNLRLDYTS